MEFLANERSWESQKFPQNHEKWTFLSLTFYNAPSLHAVENSDWEKMVTNFLIIFSKTTVTRFLNNCRIGLPRKGLSTKCRKMCEKCPKIVWRVWNHHFLTVFGRFLAYSVNAFVWWPCPMIARYNLRCHNPGSFWGDRISHFKPL